MELDVIQDERSTEVGSYFVANYPPFSRWTEGHVPAARALLAEMPAKPPPLGLYLHIPFCRKRCRFCYFRVYTDKNANEIETYLATLANEVHLYADQPYLTGRQFEYVYFGGGTPSYLSNAQLERLVERINQRWTWSAAREVTFECEPGTLKQSKLAAIKAIGVTRLSLGIEHFDDDILESNGRAHKSREVFQAYDWIRDTGFDQVNIDLIAGMVGETDAKWHDAVAKALAMQPDSLTVYQMELPHNTVISRESKEAGGESPVADWATKRRWVDEAFRAFQAEGYEISSAYTVVKPSERSGFVYRDALWRGADLVGTGVASFGHLGGVHMQNADQWGDYVSAIDRGELPLARALPISADQALIRELVLQLKLGTVDAGYFRAKFGVELRERFADALNALAEGRWGSITDDCLQLTREGLLRVDALLPLFFETEHRNIRYT